MWCFSDFGTSQADRAGQPSEFLLWRWIFWEKPVSSFIVVIINEFHQAQLSILEVIAVETCILLDPAVLHPRIVCHTGASESSDALKWKRHLFRQEFQKATVTNVKQRKICFFFFQLLAIFTPGSISWQVPQEPWVHIISMWDGWPNTTLLGAPPKEIKLVFLNDTNTSVYPITLFTIAKRQKQPSTQQ